MYRQTNKSLKKDRNLSPAIKTFLWPEELSNSLITVQSVRGKLDMISRKLRFSEKATKLCGK